MFITISVIKSVLMFILYLPEQGMSQHVLQNNDEAAALTCRVYILFDMIIEAKQARIDPAHSWLYMRRIKLAFNHACFSVYLYVFADVKPFPAPAGSSKCYVILFSYWQDSQYERVVTT